MKVSVFQTYSTCVYLFTQTTCLIRYTPSPDSKMSKRPSTDSEDRYRFFKKKRAEGDELPDLYLVFEGKVASLQTYGAFIQIPGFKKQGLVHKSQMSKSRVDDPSEMLSVGEVVHCKVISVDDDKVSLSMKNVNQTTGKDEDPNHIQLSLDEKRKKQGFKQERPKIELGAVLNTTCKKCSGQGHLAQDCFFTKGGKTYELVPDVELSSPVSTETKDKNAQKKKKKKEKKEKKSKKSKKHRHHSTSSESSDDDRHHKKKHKHKHGKKRRHRSSSTSS